jgi:hypothetical protein
MGFVRDVPGCQEDIRLLEEFAISTEDYLDAVKGMQRAKGEAGMFKAYEAAEITRHNCIAARETVERHRREHGCRMLGLRSA